jgi:hypothetical protein
MEYLKGADGKGNRRAILCSYFAKPALDHSLIIV